MKAKMSENLKGEIIGKDQRNFLEQIPVKVVILKDPKVIN